MEKMLKAIPHVINKDMNDILVARTTQEEVIKALFIMERDKAPSLDGFLMGFF